MRMKNKVALVTGAASGMGAATARMFGREGAKAVVVADVLDKEGEAVAADIKKAGGTATYLHLDVTDEAAWKSAVDKTVAAHRRLAPADGHQQYRRLPRHEARDRGDEKAGPRRLGHQSVVDLRHRRPRQHPCRLQCLQGRGAADHQGGCRAAWPGPYSHQLSPSWIDA